MKKWFHQLAHWLDIYRGHPRVWWEGNGRLMIAFECQTCGKLSDIHEKKE